jgi:hypothetical protein
MTVAISKCALVAAKWLSFGICLAVTFLMFGIAFLIPGTDVQERMLHTVAFLTLLGIVSIGSGYLFLRDDSATTKLGSTPPLRLFALSTVGILLSFPLIWFVLK